MTPDSMDAVFQALAHEKRRAILDIVRDRPGVSVGEVCKHFDVTRIAVMQHMKILEEADLLIADKRGRVRHLYVNAAPIQMIQDRWTNAYSAMWAGRALDIKYAAERRAEPEMQARGTGDEPGKEAG